MTNTRGGLLMYDDAHTSGGVGVRVPGRVWGRQPATLPNRWMAGASGSLP